MIEPTPSNTGLTTTDILAVIGAVTGIVGTIAGVSALVWDYYKWRYSERVRLKVSAIPNFVSTIDPHTQHINVSVTNVGKIPTTIKLLSFHGFNSKKELKKRNGHETSVVVNPNYGSLPARLNPGDDWTGGVQQDQFETYLKYEFFVIQIEDSISEFPFRAQIDQSRLRS